MFVEEERGLCDGRIGRQLRRLRIYSHKRCFQSFSGHQGFSIFNGSGLDLGRVYGYIQIQAHISICYPHFGWSRSTLITIILKRLMLIYWNLLLKKTKPLLKYKFNILKKKKKKKVLAQRNSKPISNLYSTS